MESLAGGRSRRTLAVSDKSKALAQLAELKRGTGIKRSDQYVVKEDDDVYDDLDEDAYQELVKQRREDNFIEDDDGNGYVDFGQDDWDDEEYSGDEAEMRKRAKGADGERKKNGVFNNLAPKKKKATERVSSVFLGAGRDVIGPSKGGSKKTAGAADDGGDELLSNLLGEIEADPMGVSAPRARNPYRNGTAAGRSLAAARPNMPTYRPGSMHPMHESAAAPRQRQRADEGDYVGALPPRMDTVDGFDEPLADVDVDGHDASSKAEAHGAYDDAAGAMQLESEAAEGNAQPVPFMTKVAESTGLDWFQVGAPRRRRLIPLRAPRAACDAGAAAAASPL